MKTVNFSELWDSDVAISGVSVIYQTPAWTFLNSGGRLMNGFLLVDRGSMRYVWDGGGTDLSHGSLIYLPKGSVHRVDVTGEGLSYYRVNFTLRDAESGEEIVFTRAPFCVTHEAGEAMFSLCADMVKSCFANAGFRTASLFGQFMEAVGAKTRTKKGGRAAAAIEYIDGHCTENTDVGKLAAMCFLSKPQFFRAFKAETGATPVAYRNDLRIERAKRLLAEGGCTVGEVAEMLGFGSIYYFDRVFVKKVGATPGSFMERR